jgi:hypothetical protein
MTTRRSEDLSSGPGLTPIESSSPSSPTDRRTEPDRTTGRIPAQEDEEDASLKDRKSDKNKKTGGPGR